MKLKRLFLTFMTMLLSISILVPDANAAATETAKFKYIRNGSLDGGYLFTGQSGDIKGTRGTCADPWTHYPSSGSTVKGNVYEISNTSLMARTAYYLYKNGYEPDSTGNKGGYGCCGLTVHIAINSARIRDGYRTNRTLSAARNKWKSWGCTKVSARMAIVDKAKAAYSKAPDNFKVYYLDNAKGGQQDAILWKIVPTGSVTITKKSSNTNHAKLTNYNNFSGIQYGIYKSDKKTKVGTFNVTKAGKSNTVSNLPTGTYYIKEEKTNDYYKLNSAWKTATVTANKTTTVAFSDAPEVSYIKIKKIDSNKRPLTGTFTFTLVNTLDSSKKYTITIKGDGKSSTLTSSAKQLWAGTYKVTETSFPSNYTNVTGSKSITVAPKKTGTLEWTNRSEMAQIKITKKDSLGKPLKGNFVFKLVNTANSKYTYNITVKGDGKSSTLTSSAISVWPGTYKVTETSAPAGYTNVTGSANITVAAKKTGTVVWTNRSTPPGSAKITKTGRNKTAMTLSGYTNFSGIKYTLYKADKKTSVGTFNIDAKGASNTITNLEPGTYYAKETQGNTAYSVDPNYYALTIASSKTTTATYSDDPIQGTAKIVKKIGGDNIPSGESFTFRLVNTQNSSITYNLTIKGNNSPQAEGSINVLAGTYKVTEISAPEDYEDVTTSSTITIEPGKTASIDWVNDRIRDNELHVRKTTDDDGPVDGFAFKVTGKLFNNGTINAKTILDTANPKAEFSVNQNEYTLGEWTVNEDDVNKLNEAAKNGETGIYEVALKNKVTTSHKVDYDSMDSVIEDIENVKVKTTFNKDDRFTCTIVGIGTDEESYNAFERTSGLAEDEYIKRDDSDNIMYWFVYQYDPSPSMESEITVPVRISLKEASYNKTDDAYENKIQNVTPNEQEELSCTISYNDFEWTGATSSYKDINTGEDYTMLTTRQDGNGYTNNKKGITEGISAGEYTVEEILTEQQKLRYKTPAKQTKVIKEDEGASFNFNFVNNAKRTDVSLVKTSPNNVVSNIRFFLTGTTTFGEKVEKTGYSDNEGKLNFGKLYAGEYVVSEPDFDSKAYINNHILTGYNVPAISFKVTGEETEPIVIEFDNKPKTSLYIAKVDGRSYSFIENAEFELYEDDKLVANFQIVANDDGTAGINIKHAEGDIYGEMVKTLTTVDNSGTTDLDEEPDDVLVMGDDKGAVNPEEIDLDDLNWAKIENLEIGKTYTLKEIVPPTYKYVMSEPKTFVFEDPTRIVVENWMPSIGTTATDSETEDHIANADGTVTIIDKVAYEHLYPNQEYLMQGSLILVDEDDMPIDLNVDAEKKFTSSETGNGFVEMTFTIDASELAGKKAVAFEELYQYDSEDTPILLTEHKDITDEGQTVVFPEVQTMADRKTTESNQKITDTVQLSNLLIGKEYTVSGTLMDKSTEKPIKDGKGDDVTAQKVFTATDTDMEVVLEFNFTNEDMLGKTGVVFEELLFNNKVVGTHKDIEDEDQTVIWPNPQYNMYKVRNEEAPIKKTDAYGFYWGQEVTYSVFIENTGNCDLKMDVSDEFDNPELFTLPVVKSVENAIENSRSEDGNVVNITVGSGETAKVVYSAIVKEETEEYLAKDDSDSDSLDADGNDCNRVDKTNEPDDKDGYVNKAKTTNVQYKDDKDDTPWKDFPNGDKEDDAQTPVQKPEIGTTLINRTDVARADVSPSGETTLVDVVSYSGLNPAKTYTVTGELILKDTGDNLVEHGEKVKAMATFTPKKPNGEVEVTFKIDTTGLVNKEIVAFETLYDITGLEVNTPKDAEDNGKKVTEHKDINDPDQTIKVTKPEIGTTATDSKTKDHLSNADKVTITDRVVYSDLVTTQEYEVKGVLMNKETKKPVTVNGKEITASTKFTPKESSGSVDIVFNFDAKDFAGKSLVAFEELYANGHLIAEHKDFNDKDQTVNVPKIGTTVGTPKDNKVEDTVKYENLIPNKEYILRGYFVEKSTGRKVKGSDGTITFTPKSANGEVKVPLSVKNATTDLVAFEYLYVKNIDKHEIEIAKHTDLTDKSQTLLYKKPKSPATGDQLPILPVGEFITATIAFGLILRRRLAK